MGFWAKSCLTKNAYGIQAKIVDSKDPEITQYTKTCPHLINYHGFTKHMSIHEFPRLITEIIQDTDRHHKLKALRSTAEKSNDTAKEDFRILSKPKIRGLKSAAVLSQMAVMVVLLKRVACFIVKVTLELRKKLQNNKPPPVFFVPVPLVPKFILNLFQMEWTGLTKVVTRKKRPKWARPSVFQISSQDQSSRFSHHKASDFAQFRPIP